MMEFVKLQIEGMTCTNCANGVKRSLEHEGFSAVSVDFTTGLASFECPENQSVNRAIDAVERLGYQVQADAGDEKKKD